MGAGSSIHKLTPEERMKFEELREISSEQVKVNN